LKLKKMNSERVEKQLQENVRLENYSTLGIGGPARFFLRAQNEEIIEEAIEWAKKQNLPLFVLGGGSNILISDNGFSGLVLQIDIRGIKIDQNENEAIVSAKAGEDWDDFVSYAVSKNLSGLECLSGIPGKVGSTPIQNVGAYGQEVKDTIITVKAYDRDLKKIVTLSNSECEFSYRHSIFKSKAVDRFIILEVDYRLIPNGRPAVRYPELQKYLSENIEGEPSLAQVREAVITVRRRKAMVVDPDDIDSRSLGSFFVNPVIRRSEFQILEAEFNKRSNNGEKVPGFAAPEDMVKLSAAWLIEHSGFCKGYKHGNVGISSKHALAIINRGSGTAEEVIELMEKIQRGVEEEFGIKLSHEPIFVGFESEEKE
jgi:UDP-N-acetylmuramate dehydrogenase